MLVMFVQLTACQGWLRARYPITAFVPALPARVPATVPGPLTLWLDDGSWLVLYDVTFAEDSVTGRAGIEITDAHGRRLESRREVVAFAWNRIDGVYGADPDQIRVTIPDGRKVVAREPIVDGDSLRAHAFDIEAFSNCRPGQIRCFPEEMRTTPRVQQPITAVALSDVRTVETRGTHPLKSALAVTGLLALVGLVAMTITFLSFHWSPPVGN